MSGRDNPFGDGRKTVIMPMPGGMPTPGRAAPLPPLPGAPPGQPLATGTVVGGTPFPVPSGGFGMPDPQSDWARASPPPAAPPPVQRVAAGTPRVPLERALGAADTASFPSANPITAAAAPLLILLGRLRLGIVEMQAVPLMNHVAQQIESFERAILAAGVPRDEAMIAKYALCGTADDIVQNLPGEDRAVWLQYSMLARFFQVRTSGVGFFEELGKALANPAARFNLLELMQACLLLGFEGQYRGATGGDAQLQRIRRDLYEALRRVRPRPDEDISPRWRGLQLRLKDFRPTVPVWAFGSFAGVILLGTFFLLRFLIDADASALGDRIIALHPTPAITLLRPEFKPYAPKQDVTQLERIRVALAPEIAAGGMAVEPAGDTIVIRVSNLVLFDSGKADTKPEFATAGARIAEALDKEPGPILVTGHTDSVKPKLSAAYKSNHDLSVARAKSVAAVIGKTVADPTRLRIDGKGELEPIADNKTADGRAQNRRVEIMIPREETLNLAGAAGATP